MARTNVRQRPVQLTPAQQIGRMRLKFPGLAVSFKKGSINWTGDWWPHPLSSMYRIQVTYTVGRRPRISVRSPRLELAEGKTRLPHVYLGGQMDICVHRPEEWTASNFIADTIMPWISQWLRFYEVWQQTGSWEGGGTHPEAESHRRAEG